MSFRGRPATAADGQSSNFSANPIECRGACVNVTGMRSLERAMKIVANAAVHKSTAFCSTCAGQAAVGPIPGDLSSGDGRVRTPLALGQHCYLQSKEINKSVTVPSTSSAKAGMMIGALELTSSKWRRLTISTKCLLGDVANTCFGYTRRGRLHPAISVLWFVFESSSGLP